uniref:Serine/threonine-protein kinase ATM n=1 Tax=Manihot esculenta TaxID=3983 RepID=A0A2C9VRS0_MANES
MQADAALMLLGSIISIDLKNTFVVPQDVWDLKLFKETPSKSVLYFITCYFSHKGSQGDLRDCLQLRKNLLTAVLGYLNLKESLILNEHLVLLLPAAVYALCAGCAPSTHCYKVLLSSHAFIYNLVAADDCAKTDENEHERLYEFFECSLDILAKVGLDSQVEIVPFRCNQSLRLPSQLRDPLLHEVETHILGALADKQAEKRTVSDINFICALLSNFIHGSLVTRKRDEMLTFVSKMGQYLLELLDHAVNVIKETGCDFQSLGCMGSGLDCIARSCLLASFRSLVSCPIFSRRGDENVMDTVLYGAIVQSMERLLTELAKLYEQFSERIRNPYSETMLSDSSDTSLQISSLLDSSRSRIVDMELDVNEDSKDVDILNFGGKITIDTSFSMVKWKLGMVSLISSFFSVLDFVTWDVLFELLGKEGETKVCENVLYLLCQHPHWSSAAKIMDLVKSMFDMVETRVIVKLDCASILVSTCQLLCTLLSLGAVGKNGDSLIHLGDLVSRVAEFGLLDWMGRVKLIDCICDFVLLSPQIGQTMVQRLFLLLQDPDYRVRFSLAQRIGVLFETWDGHDELFQDICSNFGVVMVFHSKGRLVTAKEVLAAGPQPRPTMETIIFTLMHVALHSEKIELEAIFMMCVVAAIDPCHRDLVIAVVDNLSRQLQYATRFKYLEELIGTILFFWVACGVSLVALVEIRQLFVPDAEPSYFMQYCCRWLLPALILHEDISNLNLVARIACQPSTVLVKNHFVQIFSVCMALHCSKRLDSDKGALVLQSSILHLSEISENERDKLIKRHMVSIVSHILSLTSCASDPAVPFFSRETVARAVQTVVDGFLETEDYPTSVAVLDKIKIFRPDRVFMFIVEMHYKIAGAVHHRHRCHKLAGIEVLIDILGHRAAVSSTSNYLLSLIGLLIDCKDLQDQCFRVISALLKTFKSNPSKEVVRVLGEQFQFLVSKLVEIASDTVGELSGTTSSQVMSLLLQLIVECDPSLHDYIKELEPFPETDIFDKVRAFHQELCQAYSPRDHLLKFVKRSCYLPPRLLLCSVQAMHKKLLMREYFELERNKRDTVVDINWHSDSEIVSAVWTLVRMCSSDDSNCIRTLMSDFISRVGIGDPHCVVFHLPGESGDINVCKLTADDSPTDISFSVDTAITEKLLIMLLNLLKKYLMDDSVRIVDLASQALRGILSTERGQRAILSFDSYERSLIEIHSKGVNAELVENFLLDLEKRFRAEAIPLEEPTLWETQNKTFETWICPLVHSLIGYNNDVILRLCQDIVLLKAEVAEFLLPSVIEDLAGRKNMDVDLHKLISLQVQEHILTDSNKLIKSIQVFLNALNKLRLCYVFERSSIPSKRESLKYAKPSSYGSKSRSTSGKARDYMATSSAMSMLTSSWDKVYWLSIDYLLVAKSAVICGSYFTAMMYVEYWCEEHFSSLTLGRPDLAHIEVLPDHIEVLVSAVTQINEPDSLYGIIRSHKLTSQVVTFEHEGNWSKALEYYDLQVRANAMLETNGGSRTFFVDHTQPAAHIFVPESKDEMKLRKPYKGLIKSLQKIGCTHVLESYCQGLTSRKGQLQQDLEFTELQYEAAWRAGNWDFSLLVHGGSSSSGQNVKSDRFNENLYSCLRALKEGDFDEINRKLKDSKQELVWSVSCSSEESTEYIYSTIIKLQIDRDNFLSLALEGYKHCLILGDKYDVRVVFRLVSLWFSLSSTQNIINNMLNTINEVQSYKFVPLVYQIASRMGSSKDGVGPHNFQFALISLVKKMAVDHPYHTIFQLLALANGDRIKDKQRSRNSFVVDTDKIISARALLDELSSYHGPVIGQMRRMVEIYIKLAELETRREDTNKRVALPREIRSVRQLELVPVVTSSFPVDRSCTYHDGSFPYFKGLADSIMIMNGINAPKVVECLGSDGKRYRQLAKSGNDDLRQDAVMEQFFGLVNTFLKNNRDTWKRRLGVRTYKVIPFTPSAGVLEWVNGTLPLGEYLIGSTRNGGAHGRYGIGDWSFPKCREHMSNEKDKRKAFQEICENFRPVMHHFFLERFLQPADWFEKRLAYTRSVAASSMVGYIVGLGDRHAMNILIDQTTAEVVHIDLGVAFEQGLMLKTPERVPFRLTRDIIDGMGVAGVEGVFRRCCEETLAVMRTNKEALLTIVEVFIHDPLYKWALSPLKALQRQKDLDDDLETCLEDSQDQYEGNKDAARALMRVKQKLDGYEEGELRSINGQVQQLIQDAIDPERLCQMFPGWGAWM